MGQVRILLEMAKPPILGLLTIATLAGAALSPAFLAEPASSLLGALSAAGVTSLIWTGTALVNDLADHPIDAIANPDRPLPSGRVRPGAVRLWALGSLGSALAITAVAVRTMATPSVALLLALAGILLGSLYSIPPFRLRRSGLAANLVIGAGVGLAILGGAISQTAPAPSGPLSALVLGLLATATSMVKDFKDIEGDSAQQIRTLPVLLGFRRAVLANMALVAFTYLCALTLLVRTTGALWTVLLLMLLAAALNLHLLGRFFYRTDATTARQVYRGVVLLFMGVIMLYVALQRAL